MLLLTLPSQVRHLAAPVRMVATTGRSKVLFLVAGPVIFVVVAVAVVAAIDVIAGETWVGGEKGKRLDIDVLDVEEEGEDDGEQKCL